MASHRDRQLFAKAYGNERLDALLAGHESAFVHLGGATRTILYDNPRTIVKDKDEASGHVVWNPAFTDRLDFYGIEPRPSTYPSRPAPIGSGTSQA